METLGVKARSLNLRAHFGTDRHSQSLATHYFALFTGHPFDGGVEPTIGVGNYGRATVSNNGAMWGTPPIGTVALASLGDVVWPAATALWSIGSTTPLTHWGIYSASTGGDLWYIGLVPAPILVEAIGNQPRIRAAGIRFFQG